MKLFTVGPVEMFDSTKKIKTMQTPYFRNDEFSEVMFECERLIKKLLFAPNDCRTIFLTASGTCAMEAAVMNCFTSKDKLLVISGGTFGKRFEEICTLHSIPFESMKIDHGQEFDKKCLEKFDDKGFTGMLVNIDETSTGQLYPIDILSEFSQRNHMYLMVDAISSAFADSYNIKKYHIDVTIFSSHKALALSPGLSVVLLDKEIYEERVKKRNVGLYYNFNSYICDMKRGQTPFTPAVGIVLELQDMLRSIDSIRIENKVLHTKRLASDFRRRVCDIGYKIPQYPLSNAVTPLLFSHGAKKIYRLLKEDYSIIVNPCGGEVADKELRIGHIGNLTIEDNDSLLSALRQIIVTL